jgi:2-C-methyl-D-erythritol 4-phosphate cytidylyltransferase / 2-C-methyl-D-erythritol 2,4-cyclodiphosphate synthase
MASGKKIIALIVAGGDGSRAGGVVPKQYRLVAGKPMLRHSYESLVSHPLIDQVLVVIGRGQDAMASDALAELPSALFAEGGLTRRESVRNGLEMIAARGGTDRVLIHDAARPFLTAQIINDLIAMLDSHSGAVPALPVVDSLARGNEVMGETVDRDGLWRIQTPQAFHFNAILKAHREWDDGDEASDDAQILMRYGAKVALIKGDERLAKFTYANDFSGTLCKDGAMVRTGTGFDVHRLVTGEELWLCGIKIDHTHGLSGHSDADVALHALTDAVLGAMALGDIGDHFPPSEPKWRGASSDRFLRYAVELGTKKGYRLSNADVTIICEAPRIGPHKAAMRERLADILAVDIDTVSVKATTTEMLGFTGRGEGIAAQAVVSFVIKEA